jgi:Flp pilus assembly pilin Flp
MNRRETRGAARDERGTATVEYVVILVSVALLCVLAMVGLGPPLVRAFQAQVTWLLLPFP